ncbi:MAG: putative cell division inhibitor, NAD(P)-binding [Pseudomonadota bacterium]
MVAPEVITQKSLCQVLAQALDRPCLFKTPTIVVKLIFGQMGSELLLYPTFPATIFHEYK